MSNKSKIEKQLILDTLDLMDGETTRKIPCPFCGRAEGGFAITRSDDGLVYNCFHATCHAHGFIPINQGHIVSPKNNPSKRKTKDFSYSKVPLTEKQYKILQDKYPSLTHESIYREQWQWCPEQRRLIMPVFDDKGIETGLVARYLDVLADNVVPFSIQSKAIMYWQVENSIHLHFPITYSGTLLNDKKEPIYVLVEDIPSAISVQSCGMRAIALLGTNIPKDCLNWFYGKSVVFVLDNDAIEEAIKYQEKYNILFHSCQIIHLPENLDPKDMDSEQIKEYIYNSIQT